MISTNKIRNIASKLDEAYEIESSIRVSQTYYHVHSLGIKDSHGDIIRLSIKDYPELENVANLLLDYARVKSAEKQKRTWRAVGGGDCKWNRLTLSMYMKAMRKQVGW